ncbi:MAG: DUF2189 domain-containing protein [Alphaproteobacteria bacterium]
MALPVRVARIAIDDPWRWLSAGWTDLWHRPLLSLGYGIFVAVVGALIGFMLLAQDRLVLFMPVAAGFFLIAPLLAVGLYEKSRRLQAGETLQGHEVVFVGIRSALQLALAGIVLAAFMLIWMRIATLLFALFFGGVGAPPMSEWIGLLLFTSNGLIFLATGTIVGAGLALIAFAIAAVSLPMLLERDVDVVTAMLTSLTALTVNPRPMLLWAWLIVMLIGFGLVTLNIGLIVTFPLVGHASWHCYRALIHDREPA